MATRETDPQKLAAYYRVALRRAFQLISRGAEALSIPIGLRLQEEGLALRAALGAEAGRIEAAMAEEWWMETGRCAWCTAPEFHPLQDACPGRPA